MRGPQLNIYIKPGIEPTTLLCAEISLTTELSLPPPLPTPHHLPHTQEEVDYILCVSTWKHIIINMSKLGRLGYNLWYYDKLWRQTYNNFQIALILFYLYNTLLLNTVIFISSIFGLRKETNETYLHSFLFCICLRSKKKKKKILV